MQNKYTVQFEPTEFLVSYIQQGMRCVAMAKDLTELKELIERLKYFGDELECVYQKTGVHNET